MTANDRRTFSVSAAPHFYTEEIGWGNALRAVTEVDPRAAAVVAVRDDNGAWSHVATYAMRDGAWTCIGGAPAAPAVPAARYTFPSDAPTFRCNDCGKLARVSPESVAEHNEAQPADEQMSAEEAANNFITCLSCVSGTLIAGEHVDGARTITLTVTVDALIARALWWNHEGWSGADTEGCYNPTDDEVRAALQSVVENGIENAVQILGDDGVSTADM